MPTNSNNSLSTTNDLSEKVPNSSLAIYAIGSVCGGFGWTVNMLTNPIFNIEMGVSLIWLGIVISINRVIDAFSDIIVGYISDRFVTRWGRRRPFIFVGGLVMAFCYFLLWMFPRDMSHSGLLIWYAVIIITFHLGTTLFGTGYWALGIELTMDYNERTRVSAWRQYANAAVGLTTPWFLWFIHNRNFFSDPLTGMRVLGTAIAIVMLLSALLVSFVCKERYAELQREKKSHLSFLKAITVMVHNKEFIRMTAVGLVLMTALVLFEQFGLYLNFYYVFGGDKEAATVVGGVAGTVGTICGIVGIPIMQFLSKRFGKHIAVRFCLAWMILGSVSKWFLITPAAPYLQVLIPLFYSIGISAFYTLLPSITADIIDVDELYTGERREAMFSAVGNLVGKIANAVVTLGTGFVMAMTGFVIEKGGAQSPETFLNMRLLYSFASAGILGLALIIVWGYSLTPARMAMLQAEILEKRKSR